MGDLLRDANSKEVFDFKSQIRLVNSIKNTTLKLKSEGGGKIGKTFDPDAIDERVRDFYFDLKANKLYVALLCGQVFVFDRKMEEGLKQPKFKISKKVTLKQKILKMKKIEGVKKEEGVGEELSQKFDEELEAMTTTTTRSRTISLASSQRSSSLMRMTESNVSKPDSICQRPRSLQRCH